MGFQNMLVESANILNQIGRIGQSGNISNQVT